MLEYSYRQGKNWFSLAKMHLGTYDRTLICDPKDPNFILKFNSEKVSENYTLYSPNTSKFEATALQTITFTHSIICFKFQP